MATVAELLGRARELDHISDTARLDVELILGLVMNKERSWFFSWPDFQLSRNDSDHFEQLFARRLRGEPVAHIIGSRGFWTLDLDVDNSTLIPRPDTEVLVEVALQLAVADGARVLDLGTGSGAIALALASEKPHWSLLAVDRIEKSVVLARRNRDRHGLDNVEVNNSNWFSNIDAEDKFDLIVSNPPYIDPDDEHLSQGDVRFEPLSALVADQKGMADIRAIATVAPGYLKPTGWLVFEHGCDQGEIVRETLFDLGFSLVQTRQDYGGNDRVTFGQWGMS